MLGERYIKERSREICFSLYFLSSIFLILSDNMIFLFYAKNNQK